MLRFLVILFIGLVFNSSNAFSTMPTYDATDYYYQCLDINRDSEYCGRQDTSRIINEIKKQYRIILTTPSIIGWHKDISENTSVLRDMYESWTAFRTRLCSLSNKSAQYLEKLVEEKLSCNLYYSQHHNAHLNSIIQLLAKQVPNNKNQFNYLRINSHDDKYKECRKDNGKNCIKKELERTTKRIKNIYKTMLEDEYLGKWNNGPDLKNGNYRDMYDSWIAYRNRMCSLSVWAYQVGYGQNAMTTDYCLLFFNIEKLDAMENILVSAHSSLDEEMVEEDDDGGEAEGKTIKPLERRFDERQNKEDALESEEKAEPLIKKAEPKKQAPEKKVNIPSWAK